ncbi:RHS repeat protein [Fulvivirga sp. M361]|uniref:RHS repeat domain-containing protein n=1 Tax=Fulvivirga sp. M361 TaxID=2594266 RepID=UPI00117B6F50|nr:RHS repeat protein [Fulvivirga sp. M361]TRX47066.1 RHS repeat protein [Fulvivirga sp. M361]
MEVNIFSKRVQANSDKDLLKYLKRPQKYEPKLIEAVLAELSTRKVAIPQELKGTFNTGNKSQHTVGKNDTNTVAEKKKPDVSQSFNWLPGIVLLDHLSYYMLLLSLSLVFSINYFSNSVFVYLLCVSPLIPLIHANGISNSKNRREYHFQVRMILSVFIIAIISFRGLILFNSTNELKDLLIAMTIILVLSGIFSWPLYKYSEKWKRLKITSLKYVRFTLILTGPFLLACMVLHNSWFHPLGDVSHQWKSKTYLDYTDFGGYPRFFTEYDAGIRSEIEFKVNSPGETNCIEARFYPKYTWMNPWDKGESYLLLQHERYHFNITEMTARMARREIISKPYQYTTRAEMNDFIATYKKRNNRNQYLYDHQTDHSIKTAMQSIWQFKIDSTLTVLDSYWKSEFNMGYGQNETYHRFIEQTGDLRITGRGNVLPYEHDYGSYYKFYYDDKYGLNEINYYRSGSLEVDPYFGAAVIQVKQVSEHKTLYGFYNAKGKAVNNRFGYHTFIETQKGQHFQYQFFDLNRNKVRGPTGEFVTKVTRNTQEQIISKHYLDQAGNRMKNSLGQYELLYSYLSEPGRILIKNYDANGKRMAEAGGNYLYYYEYNEQDELIKSYTQKGKEFVDIKDSIAIKEFIYDELGYESKLSYYDGNHHPREDGDGIWCTINATDRYGNVNMHATYNSNGVLVNDDMGIAMRFWEFDSLGRTMEYSEYDRGGIIVFDEDGFGKVRYTYDNQSRVEQITNLNGYDHPVSTHYQGPTTHYLYDTSKNLETGYYTDADDNVTSDKEGVYAFALYRDDNGNLIRSEYYDDQGNLKESQYDVAIYQYSYDNSDNKLETKYFNAQRLPAYAFQGAHINRYTYDSLNRMIERSYYDTLDQLIEFDNYALIQWDYDVLDNNVETRYYNKDGVVVIKRKYENNNLVQEVKLTHDYKGIATEPSITRYTYDDRNNLLSTSYYNLRNSPVTDKAGVHRYENTYDQLDRGQETKYYSTNGQPVEIDGIWSIKYQYDHRNNVIRLSKYNDRDQLQTDAEGIAIERYEYDLYPEFDTLISKKCPYVQ